MRLSRIAALAVAAPLVIGSLALAYALDTTAAKPLAAMDKPVNDFKLKDLTKDAKEIKSPDDAFIAVSSYKERKSVVVFFMSETCSVTWRYERRVGELLKKYGKDVAFLGMRCSANDTPQGICKFAATRNFDMPILNDEKGQVTRYFDIHQTPTFILIDKEGVLRYKGGFDDNADEAKVQHRYLPDAIDAVLNGKQVATKETRALG